MEVKKILGFIGIGFLVLIVSGVGYLHFTDTRPKPTVNIKAVQQPALSTNKSKEVAKKTAKKIAKKDQTALVAPVIPEIPVINRILPDKEIEFGVKVSPEKAPAKGVLIRPEFCWVTEKPEKIVKSAPCINGFIDLTDYGLAEIKANIKVSKNENGEDCVFILDENGKEVEFRYTASLGDMFGLQTKSTLKLFAIGLIRTEEPYFVIMECTNALEKGKGGNISLMPVANFVKKESVRKVLEDLYLAQENIDLLFPASEKVAQLK